MIHKKKLISALVLTAAIGLATSPLTGGTANAKGGTGGGSTPTTVIPNVFPKALPPDLPAGVPLISGDVKIVQSQGISPQWNVAELVGLGYTDTLQAQADLFTTAGYTDISGTGTVPWHFTNGVYDITTTTRSHDHSANSSDWVAYINVIK